MIRVRPHVPLRTRDGKARRSSATALLLLAACASSGPYPLPMTEAMASTAPEPERTRLEAGAVVDVKFFYTPEINESQVVRPDGRISLQLLGDVDVRGMTPDELRSHLVERYTGKLVDPEITVVVRSTPSRTVMVGGQVARPGSFEMPRQMTVLEALMLAGGVDVADADVGRVLVIRERDGGSRLGYLVDLEPTLRGEPAPPFYLHPRDLVYVPRTWIATANQWVDQHLTKMFPDVGLFVRWPIGEGQIGAGLTR